MSDNDHTANQSTFSDDNTAGDVTTQAEPVTSRNDVAMLHDKLQVAFHNMGLPWPKDSETGFHLFAETDYSEGDGIGENPRFAPAPE